MAASCVSAMIAQFAPLPFPASRPVLGVCGSLYFLLSGILQLLTTHVDRDAILWTRPREKDDTHKHALLTQFGVCVRSNFPRFSEYYTVRLEIVQKDAAGKMLDGKSLPAVSQTWSVGNFFDKEGYFYEAGVMEETRRLFARLEAGKYDAKDSSKVKKA